MPDCRIKLSTLFCAASLLMPISVQAQTKESSQTTTPTPTIDEDIIVDQTKDDEILFVQDGNLPQQAKDNSHHRNFSLALQLKDYPKIEKYLNGGANINHVIYDGNTIINISSFHRDTNLLVFAATNKGNLSHLNNNGESILYWGGAGKKLEYLIAIKQLMSPKAFADLMATSTKGKRTPLHAAVLYEADPLIMNWLLLNGVNMEAKDENGQTALHYAAAMTKWDALSHLLQKGGKIKEVDSLGSSVEDYILERFDVLSIGKVYPYLSPLGKWKIDERLGVLPPVLVDKIKKSDLEVNPQ